MVVGRESSLAMRNVVVGGHRTTVRLEPVMWDALHDIARQRQVTVDALVTDIDGRRTASSLTAAIRVYIVEFYRARVDCRGAQVPAGPV